MRNLIIAAFLLIFTVTSTFAQQEAYKGADEDNSKKSELEYLLRFKNPLGIRTIYKMHEVTEVKREFDDGTNSSYTRERTFFYSFKMADLPKDDFVEIRISIDSMHYKFTEGDKVFEANSQADDFGSKLNQDIQIFSIPLGKEYNMLYSPYGEITKIYGERLDFFRDYVEKNSKDKQSHKYITWTNQLADDNLEYIADVKKLYFPPGKVKLDSSWTSPFLFQMDGINMTDTVTVRPAAVRAGYIEVVAQSDSLHCLPQNVLTYNIQKPVEILAGKGKGTYKAEIHPRGFINSAEAVMNAEIEAKIAQNKFKMFINSKVNWDIVIQVRY